MESYLNENFGDVKAKNSSEEALQRWRKLCWLVKNRKRRFRFTANLTKRNEAEAIRRSNQEKFRVAVLVSQAALQFIHGLNLTSEYVVPEEVKDAGFEICADELGSVVEGRDVKKLKIHGGVEGIASKLSTSLNNGIPTSEQLLSKRKEIHGINKFTESPVKGFLTFVWEALQDMTLMILGICAFVSLIVGIAMEGWPKGAHDGLGIVASILLVVFVTATSDYRQSLQFKDLDREKKKITVQVTRDGCRQKISIYDLLPGDIVHLSIGDQVPADGLFLSGFSVLINESSLTGESEPVNVNSHNPFLLSGTKVQDGSCKMLVTTVGMRTQWGKLMATLSEGGDDETPLQVKLNGVATIIGKIGLFFALVTFAVLVQGLFSRKLQEGSQWTWSGDDAREILEFFAVAVTIVVVAVPEGLPLAVTLSLAFAMKKMMNDKALVRHLAACETMGSATTICSDKTGTLTTNHMTVVKACICGKIKDVGSSEEASNLGSDIPDSALKILLQSIFNNTGGEVVKNKDGKNEMLGTPTETALLEFGLMLGGDFQAEKEASKIVKVEPFNSTKKRMGVVLELPEGGLRAHCKGASEIILAACDKVIDSKGEVVPLDKEYVYTLNNTIEQFANEALRTLCLGYMELESEFSAESPIPSNRYICIGIVGIKDPVRPGVRESVAICRSAGITVRMVTGDNINTAKAIARECGILTENGLAIEGPEFREKSEEELHKIIPKIQVMARSSPLDKHALVKHLRTTFEEVVAVTSDGTNDAPALHEADIGLAMGIAGTEERTFRDLSTRGDVSFALCHYYGESSSEFPEESPHRLWALVACASDNDPDHLITRLIANLKSSSTEEQKKAALDVKSLAKNNSENRLKIAKAGAIMPLISLLISSSDLQLQEYAVTAILNLSLCDENKELITSSGAINPLVQALMTGNRTTKENAACALHHLSLVEEKKIEIGQSGAIPLLVNLLEHGESQGKKDAMMALCTLCSVKENKIQAIRVGIMKLLVAFMADFNSILLDMSVCMVSVLVSEPEAGTALVEERGIPVVVKILWSGFPRQKETAVKVLLHICEISVTYRALLVQEDAIFPLLQLSRSTTSVKQEAETLIELLRQPRSRNTAAAAKQDNQ